MAGLVNRKTNKPVSIGLMGVLQNKKSPPKGEL
jgi:hypothetical protein